MKLCTVSGCHELHEAKGLCIKHYGRFRRHGAPILVNSAHGESINFFGYRSYRGELEHIKIAETTLGRKLPKGTVVHHVDENRLNNMPDNLVICSRSYHMTIHARMRARDACGNPNWKACQFCGKFDDLASLYTNPKGTSHYHKSCRAAARAKPLSEWKAHRGSISGLLGAHWRARTRKWEAIVKHNGQTIYLGAFPTAQAAHQRYMVAKIAIKDGFTVPGAHMERGKRLVIK